MTGGRGATLIALALAGASVVAAPATAPATAPAPPPARVAYDPEVAAMIAGVTRGQLKPVVAELSGAAPAMIGGSWYTFTTRSSDSGAPIDKAEQYVYEHLQTYGLDSVAYQSFPGGGGAPPGRNIIGQIDGTTAADEIVIIGAHIDDRPKYGRAPGADDNASGVSAVLYLARAFADETFARTIRFAFFGDEENLPGALSSWGSKYGSGYYAAKCRAAGEDIVAMISADMLAFDHPRSREHVVELSTRSPGDDPGGADRAIFTIWHDAIDTYSITGLTPRLLAVSDEWSDHGSFWANDYPAAMLIEEEWDYWNPNWHTRTDTMSTFSWWFYVAVTKSLVAVAAHEAGVASSGAAP